MHSPWYSIFQVRAYSAGAVRSVRDFDFNAYLTKKYSDCLKYSKWAVIIDSINYYDFGGDGSDEAVLTASSCLTGTAGPDIHAVYKLGQDGTVRELPINDNGGRFQGSPIYNYLVGNRNYSFGHHGGILLEIFHDGSGQPFPLTLSFKWSGREFDLVDVAKDKRYKTSFDCDKAESDAEKTICVNPDLAKADVELASVYKKLGKELAGGQKTLLREEQRKWLAARDAQCSYKWVHECLKKRYARRIKTLKKRLTRQ